VNISLKNKCIWLSPERTAGKTLETIFRNCDFYSCSSKNNYELKSFLEEPHSRDNIIPKQYNEFHIISTVRNPYDRIWSCFVNFYLKNFSPKNFEDNKSKFNNFIENSFRKTLKGVETDTFFNGNDYINKWKFEDYSPQTIIKFENLHQDLISLDFMKNSVSEVENLFSEDKKPSDTSLISFDTVYETESAKKVFQFYKNHFYSFDYDPFSFTNEVLSDEQKIQFLHSH
jgi:hypothetical protein